MKSNLLLGGLLLAAVSCGSGCGNGRMPFGSQVAARDPFIDFSDQQNAPEATIRPATAFDSDGQQPATFAAAEQEQRDQSWTTAKPVWTPQGTLQQTADASR